MKVGTFGVNWVTNNIDPRWRRRRRGRGGGGGGGSDGGDAGGGGGGGGDSGRFESRLHAETLLAPPTSTSPRASRERSFPVNCTRDLRATSITDASLFTRRFPQAPDIDRLLHREIIWRKKLLFSRWVRKIAYLCSLLRFQITDVVTTEYFECKLHRWMLSAFTMLMSKVVKLQREMIREMRTKEN